MKIENYSIKIDGRNIYDQPINDSIKQYDETEKYQQDRVVISRLVLCWVLLILGKITD